MSAFSRIAALFFGENEVKRLEQRWDSASSSRPAPPKSREQASALEVPRVAGHHGLGRVDRDLRRQSTHQREREEKGREEKGEEPQG